MLSFHRRDENDIAIAHAYATKDCVGKPISTVYFIADYSGQPEIESNDIKGLVANEQFRIQQEFALSRNEFREILKRVEANQPIIETSSRTLKRAYLEISRIVHEKLKKQLEFSARDKVFLKPIYDTTTNRTNQICTMFASSGAGKSYMINDILMRNPAIQTGTVPSIHLFSSVGDNDPSYAPIKAFYGERFFWIDPRDVDQGDLTVGSYTEKSVLIFDDINSISDKRIRAQVIHFRETCLEVARHRSLVIISSEHLFHNRKATQKLRNSSAYYVLYPRNSPKPIDDVLDNQFNIGRHERFDLIKKLKREGRAQFLHVDSPNYVVNTKRVMLF